MAIPIGLILSAGSTLFSFFGKKKEAKGEKQAAAFNAAVARNNAIVARQQMGIVHDIGKVKSARLQLGARQDIGATRAAGGSSGARVNVGSNVDAVDDIRMLAGIDASTIRANTAREVQGLQFQATNFDAQAGLILATGSNRAAALNMEGVSTLLTGAAKVASKWKAYKKETGEDPLSGFFNTGSTGASFLPNALRSTPPTPRRAPR